MAPCTRPGVLAAAGVDANDSAAAGSANSPTQANAHTRIEVRDLRFAAPFGCIPVSFGPEERANEESAANAASSPSPHARGASLAPSDCPLAASVTPAV